MKHNNIKSLTTRNIEGYYTPDDIDVINNDDEIYNYEDGFALPIDEILDERHLKKITAMVNNYQARRNSTNYTKATNYLSKLKRKKDGRTLSSTERKEQLEKILKSNNEEAVWHFTDLIQNLYSQLDYSNKKRYSVINRNIEYPLECMGSFVLCTINSDDYLRRKYYDGQTRKRSDGSTYTRNANINTESDLIVNDENDKQISPLEAAEVNDNYFSDCTEMLSVLDDKERQVILYIKNGYTIQDIIEKTDLTKRQIETIKNKIRFKLLKYLKNNDMPDDYEQYLSLCKNRYKDFSKKYKNFLKKCEK